VHESGWALGFKVTLQHFRLAACDLLAAMAYMALILFPPPPPPNYS